MISRHTNLFAGACWLVAILSGVILCLGAQIFIDYQHFAIQHSNWLDQANSIAAQNSALNLITAKARLFQFALLLLWCAYAGMTAWVFMLRKQVGLTTCLLLLSLFVVVFVTGYYSLYAWQSENILIFNIALLVGMLLWVWVACSNKASMLPPSYRFRILKPWVLVAFVLVLMQAVLSSIAAIIHNSDCKFWPYCSSLLNLPANWQSGSYASGLLLLLGRDFSYQFASIICFAYLLTLAVLLICLRHFEPLRRLGLALLICTCAQFYLSVHSIAAPHALADVVIQQAFIFSALATLMCLCYRIFSKNILRRLYI